MMDSLKAVPASAGVQIILARPDKPDEELDVLPTDFTANAYCAGFKSAYGGELETTAHLGAEEAEALSPYYFKAGQRRARIGHA